mgnify:CR=1 FL=1
MRISHLNISSSAVIRNQKIILNGKVVFESNTSGLEFLRETYEKGLRIDYPKFYKMDVLGKLGIVGAHVLLKDFDFNKYQPEEVGIVLSNRNSSLEADINYFETAKTFPSPALFVYTLPNIVIGEISIRYKFKGENAFFVSEDFDAEWLHYYVDDLFKNRKIEICICGWIESVDGRHDVCLFLIEKEQKENGLNFTPENLKEIYEQG